MIAGVDATLAAELFQQNARREALAAARVERQRVARVAARLAARDRLVHRCGCGLWTTDDPRAPRPHRCALYRELAA